MPGMIVGYARSSTADQLAGMDGQIRNLEAAGCERVFSEHVSAVGLRPQLRAAMDFIREGDMFVVTKPDRLARSTADLLKIVDDLKARKIGVRILSMGLNTLDNSNPTTMLMLTILAGVATWEREIMLERQREGIAKAKADGKYRGRAPTARAKAESIIRLAADGHTREAIAEKLKIGIASVYRVLAEAREAGLAA